MQLLDPSQAVITYHDKNLFAKLSTLTQKKLARYLSKEQTNNLLVRLYNKAEKNVAVLKKT